VSAKNDNIDPPSKSSRKREAERLQKIGRRLTDLNAEQLEILALPSRLLASIADYQRFPSREAKRRQLQYIGKVMRNVDIEAIEHQLATLDGESAQARFQFSQLEQWRDDLIDDPAALTRFLSEYHNVDVQRLRQLINKTRGANDGEQKKTNARALFRFLRNSIDEDS
jgi:ribosome-associated protein